MANGVQYLEDASSANFQVKFKEWVDSQVYGRYFDDPMLEGELAGISKKKMFQNIMDYVATLSLGFNSLANLANVTNGIAM